MSSHQRCVENFGSGRVPKIRKFRVPVKSNTWKCSRVGSLQISGISTRPNFVNLRGPTWSLSDPTRDSGTLNFWYLDTPASYPSSRYPVLLCMIILYTIWIYQYTSYLVALSGWNDWEKKLFAPLPWRRRSSCVNFYFFIYFPTVFWVVPCHKSTYHSYVLNKH